MPSVYIETPGNVVAMPPFLHQGATLHALLLPSSHTTLQGLVDVTLNKMPGVHFNVEGNLVLMTAVYVTSVTSTNPLWADHGLASETDIGFWILTKGGPTGAPPQLRWWPVYLFVDSGPALVIGRELYGFPKHMATFERDSDDLDNDLGVRVRTQFFQVYSETAHPVTDVLVSIKRTKPPSLLAQVAALVGEVVPVKEMNRRIGEAIYAGSLNAPDVPLPYLGLPMVFLRQLRDIANPSRAAVQNVTAVVAGVTGALPRVTMIKDDFAVTCAPADSHPIAAHLGLQPSTRPALVARVGLDFVVPAGQVIA